MASPLVSRAAAQQKLTHHQHVKGIGFLAHSGPPEIPPGVRPSAGCAPPSGTKDGTHHELVPPNGGAAQRFRWVAQDRAWAPIVSHKGNRMAFTADHLRAAGWSYGAKVA